MKIVHMQTDHYRIPLPVVLSDSMHGDMAHFDLVSVRLRDEQGVEGLGYTYSVSGAASIYAMIKHDFEPLLLQADCTRIERIWNKLWWQVHFIGRGGVASFAQAAVDIALWDLQAKRQGVPLWRLLGGYNNRVKAYAGGIDLQFSLDRLIKQTENFLAQGFTAIKMKVGRDRLSEDLARVGAMRELLGADTPLMVDANMRWGIHEAIRAARGLAEHNVYWLEEPIIPDDIAGHARIAREAGVPLATGENFHTVYEFRHMIAHGGIAFPEPDVATIGGITPWLKVAHLAETHNLPVTTHGVHDLQVHLLAAVPNASYLEVHGFGLERFIEQPLQIENGEALAPDRPGHGVVFDWDGLAAHRLSG